MDTAGYLHLSTEAWRFGHTTDHCCLLPTQRCTNAKNTARPQQHMRLGSHDSNSTIYNIKLNPGSLRERKQSPLAAHKCQPFIPPSNTAFLRRKTNSQLNALARSRADDDVEYQQHQQHLDSLNNTNGTMRDHGNDDQKTRKV